uniref:Unspecific monooxygenase n=1 Tax=Meloidogyne hapla TaxID=6305 RepID=A0A1I8BY93_MELHA
MPEKCFLTWRRKYGNIFTIWFGEQPHVCIADYNKIMETFQKDGETYSGRYRFEEFEKLIKGGSYGLIMIDGDLWREQRRFALQIFRDFGLGKNLMQEKILSELELLFERIEEEIKQGNQIDFGENIDISVGSIINNFLFGYRFDNERLGEFKELKKLLDYVLDTGFQPIIVLLQLWPSLRYLPFINSYFEEFREKNQQFFDFHQEQINEHLNSINSPPTDFVEAFLLEKQQRDATGKPHDFTIEQLRGVVGDLWFAGQETTSTTLNWGIAFLINYPNVQAKVHAELDSIIGDVERIITTADRPSLPYLNALINEIQRMANLVPLNVFHTLTKDVKIDGYFLPKDTIIIPQISAVLADEEVFEKSEEFNPERFLDENGKLKRVDELIPFSVGKRQCLGESLARMELFLFLGNLLNKYIFLPGKDGIPSLKRTNGGTARCKKFKCQIKRREECFSN